MSEPKDNRPVDHTRCYQGELTGIWYCDYGRVCHRTDIHEPPFQTKVHTKIFTNDEMRGMLRQHSRGLGLTEADIDAMMGIIRPDQEIEYGPAQTHALVLELEGYAEAEQGARADRLRRAARALTVLSLRLGGGYSRMAERAAEPEEKPAIALPARDPDTIDFGTPGQADFNPEAYRAECARVAEKMHGVRDPRPPMDGPETDGYTGYLRDDDPSVQALRDRINTPLPKDLS